MDILFNIGQAFVMGLIAFTITRWGYVKQIKILYLQGRLNRLQFLIGLIGMTIVVGLFNTMIATMMDSVVILIAYWGVRILSFWATRSSCPSISYSMQGASKTFHSTAL